MDTICRIYYRKMTPEEQIRTDLHRYQHAMAEELLRQGYQELFGQNWSSGRIQYGEKGKPTDRVDPACFFNFSHCRTAVAAAVSHCPVGVDVESFRRVRASVVKRSCSSRECAYIFSGGESSPAQAETEESFCSSQQIRRFLQLWTLKESYVKMTGDGISDMICRQDFDVEVLKKEQTGRLVCAGNGTDGIVSYSMYQDEIQFAVTLQQENAVSDCNLVWSRVE